MIVYTGGYPDDMWEALEEALHGGLPLQGDYTRSHSTTVALMASLGWITTIRIGGDEYGNRWYITAQGLAALEDRGTTL